METELQKNPTNFQNTLELARFYFQIQQTNRAVELLRNAIGLFDQALANPNIRYPDVAAMAQIAAQLGDMPKLEILLQKLISLAPDQPEPHYDLAALYAIVGKTSEALQNLQASLDLSAKRLATNPRRGAILGKSSEAMKIAGRTRLERQTAGDQSRRPRPPGRSPQRPALRLAAQPARFPKTCPARLEFEISNLKSQIAGYVPVADARPIR